MWAAVVPYSNSNGAWAKGRGCVGVSCMLDVFFFSFFFMCAASATRCHVLYHQAASLQAGGVMGIGELLWLSSSKPKCRDWRQNFMGKRFISG